MSMDIKLYDRVLLKNGYQAIIVEIFADGKDFLADIDYEDDTYTEVISISDILCIIE